MRDPRLDILFESMQIGPVTAKNRFGQVSQCNDGGYRDPSAEAEMRGFGIIQHFLSRATGHRMGEYGGSLEDLSRFVREVVGDTMWLTLRASLDKTMGDPGFPDAKGASSDVLVVRCGPAKLEVTRTLAELPIQKGCTVKPVTPAAYVGEWILNTLEQHETHWRLVEIGVTIELSRGVTLIGGGHMKSNCTFTDTRREIACDGLVLVSSRAENNRVYLALKPGEAEWADVGTTSVTLIGDAKAPGLVAWTTCAGHRYARELNEQDIGDALPFRCKITELATP